MIDWQPVLTLSIPFLFLLFVDGKYNVIFFLGLNYELMEKLSHSIFCSSSLYALCSL